MGNEKSQPAGLTIDDTSIEITENWTLHGATCAFGSIPKVSVFISSAEQLQVSCLEKFTKNIMIYRHPSILKYVASWRKGPKFYLATEQVQPLSQVLPSQTSLQICVGLQSILKALVFLHDSASASHNNVCQAAIYVTQGGSWKLGGLEYLSRFSEMSSGYLEEKRPSRYDPAVSPDEMNHLPQPLTSIDCYAFGVLAQEVLPDKNNDDVPGKTDFLEMCKRQLQSSNPELRPSLSSLLNHIFFSHEFLTIHNFLQELPIKEEKEKQEFFRNLTVKLGSFPEDIVASQLGSLLLSRIVLLDSTAQKCLLPQVFNPRKDDSCRDNLFSESTFKTHMVPRLLPLFCVRDAQIRLILLTHFHSYCSLFSHVQLQSRILPELLVGIKDTNDSLVCTTLRALADLVPILGGAVVIGGKRLKVFADGRPKTVKSPPEVINKERTPTEKPFLFTEMQRREDLMLPERPSPDGGECVPTTNTSEDETWPDWDYKGIAEVKDDQLDAVSNQDHSEVVEVEKLYNTPDKPSSALEKLKSSDEFEEIFREMEPIISKPQVVHVQDSPSIALNKFSLSNELCEADGWGEDFSDWNDTDEDVTKQATSLTS